MSTGGRDNTINEAKAAGKSVVFADDVTLQIDVDSDTDFKIAKGMLKLYAKFIAYSNCTYTKSKTEGHFHIYVNLKSPMDWKRRLHFQSCLGSDRQRELLNWTDREDLSDEEQKRPFVAECFFIEAKDAEHELLRL